VVARWHNDELPIRQTSEYFGIFFDGGEVVVAAMTSTGIDIFLRSAGSITTG